MPKPNVVVLLRVNDLIDSASGTWNESLLNEVFLSCDSKAILGIHLCNSWPPNRFVGTMLHMVPF